MEVISSADLLFLKAVACGATAYFSQSWLQRFLQRPSEPLIPEATRTRAVKSASTLPPTRSISKALKNTGRQCIVFYGSQTGTAERLAHQFAVDAKARYGLECLVADLSDYDFDDLLSLSDQTAAVFLLATYGEGEATDNSIAFGQYLTGLQPSVHSTKSSLCYAGFGLGNSSYQYYNEMIRKLDCALSRASSERIGRLGFGDDGKATLEGDFLNWKREILPMLAARSGLHEQLYKYTPLFNVVKTGQQPGEDTYLGEPNIKHLRGKQRGPYTLQNPFAAPLTTAKQLCPGSERQFLHIEFDLGTSTLDYEVGDHLAMRASNSEKEVSRFLRVFGMIADQDEEITISTLDRSTKSHFPARTTLSALARYYLDICAPVSRHLLSVLASMAPSEQASNQLLALIADENTFKNQVLHRLLNISQVLETYTTVPEWSDIPTSVLLENIATMRPRYYSISSSPKVQRSLVSITSVVESKKITDVGDEFKGVASSYLLALSSANSLARQPPMTHYLSGRRSTLSKPTSLISIRRSAFKLPREASVPIIMIGPGTGVAPFRGFIQSRLHLCKEGCQVGRTILFYGCRRQSEDFLYADEWERAERVMTSTVFSIYTAFSREEGQPKTYVQHLFKQHAEELRRLILTEHARVYVCGDAKKMAVDVRNAMGELLCQGGETAENDANGESCILRMRSEGRWLEDVW